MCLTKDYVTDRNTADQAGARRPREWSLLVGDAMREFDFLREDNEVDEVDDLLREWTTVLG